MKATKQAQLAANPYVSTLESYVSGVLSWKIPACKWVKLACERHKRDIEASKTKGFPYVFDAAKAQKACGFMELLPHVKGEWARPKPGGGMQTMNLEPWQVFVVASIFGWVKKSDSKRRFQKARLYIPRKNGKALAMDTLIPTPSGWTTMAEIKAGDYVFHPSGKKIAVQGVTEAQHNRPCYRVTFSNGEVAVADENHEWITTARVDQTGGPKGFAKSKDFGGMTRVRTTKEIFDTQTYGARGDRNHTVQMPCKLQCETRNLPIPPYTLGAWLGDGHTDSPAMTFDEADNEIFKSIIADGFPMRVRESSKARAKARTWHMGQPRGGKPDRNGIRQRMIELGILGNKRIPTNYFRASIEQRLALLQGMMDTDGTISKNGRVLSFTTIKRELAEDIGHLLATFGIKHSIIGSAMKCNGKSVKGTAYDVQFMAFRDEVPCFRLQRKLNRMRLRTDCKISPRSKTVQIASVEKCDSAPVRCIQVDSPDGLYLFGRTMIPTHNSFFGAGIGLYMAFLDGEPGAEVYSGATSEKQAWEVFGPARQMVLRLDLIRKHLNIEANAQSLIRMGDNSKFLPVIGKPGDGSSPHCAIIDEYHEHKTSELIDTMETGMGARRQPLSLVISTAGSDIAGPCREDWKTCERILENAGGFEDETTFCVIWTIDDGDKWDTEAALIKANPNWGVSINSERIMAELKSAQQNARKQSAFKTKYLNQWVTAKDGFFNTSEWEKLKRPIKREDYKDTPCILGSDLASRHDLVCIMQLFLLPDKRYAIFGKYYLPADTIDLPENQHYRTWVREGWIESAGDAIVDYLGYQEDAIKLCKEYQVQEFAFDPNRAYGVMPALQREGVPMVEYTQATVKMSVPMKELDGMIRDGRIIHNGDPVLAWALSNVVAREDAKSNVFPRKENEANKIDPVVSALMALGRAMLRDDGPKGPLFAW